MASAAIIDCDFDTSAGKVVQECLSTNKMVSADSCAISFSDFSAEIRCGIHNVAASETWSLGKLVNMTLMVFNTSSFITSEDHSSFSSAAAD